MSATSSRVFTRESDGSGGYDPLDITVPDLQVQIKEDGNDIIVSPTDAEGLTWTYHGVGTSIAEHKRGLPQKVTDAYGVYENTFTFGTSGNVDSRRMVSVMTAQGFTVEYDYIQTGNNFGRIESIELLNDDSKVIQRIKYTYFDTGQGYSSDASQTKGDLLLVEVLKRDSNDNLSSTSDSDFGIQELTHYRYGSVGSKDSLMTHVFTAGDIERILDDKNDGSDIDDILGWSDAQTIVTGKALEDYASRSYEYYSSNVDMTSVTTPWGGTNENLSSKYNDDPATSGNQIDDTGRVKLEIARGTPDAEDQLLTYQFLYMDVDMTDPDDPASTKRIVVIDTVDSNDQPVLRKLVALNHAGIKLREVLMPDSSSTDYWSSSWVLGGAGSGAAGQVVEERTPESHVSVDTDAELAKFLNPTNATNDADTVSSTDGAIVVNEYDSMGRLIAMKLKKGSSGTAYYTSALTYDATSNLVTESYDYDVQTTTKTDGHKTTYSYTYHTSAADGDIEVTTTTYPAVPTSQNGPGVSGVEKEYFDASGRLRWTKNLNGSITYQSYDINTGKLAYQMDDVDTDDLPTQITSGQTGDWPGWSGSVPSGFENTDDDNVQEVATTVFDDLGRPVQSQDSTLGCCGSPSAVELTYRVYAGMTEYVFPAWDDTNQEPRLPIEVTTEDHYGNVLEDYTVDPARVEVVSGEPVGLSSGTTQSHYLSWSRSEYNEIGQLLYEDSYHDIPSTGTGTLSTNYYRSVFRYDDQGRLTHQINIVSGTSSSNAKEQVTETVFDNMDRTVATKVGVSSTSHNMGSDWATDPTLATISELEYDSDGVGDGLVTKSKQFHDTGVNDYTASIQHYDWRDHLRGAETVYHNGTSEVAVGPFSIVDYGWAGHAIASGTYDTNPTWSAVVTDEDYAASITSNRRSLTKSLVDDLNRVYRTETYIVDSSTGAAGDKQVSDIYHDAAGRVVAQSSSAGISTEYALDGMDRAYQVRQVKALSSTKFTSGSFNYRTPLPKLDLDDMAGGDDGVVSLNHTVFDGNGKAVEQISVASMHDDTSGIDWSNKDDLIASYTYGWYDDSGRMAASAQYGTAASGYSQASSAPSRPSSAPSSSDTVLVTSVTYDPAGRQDTVAGPKGQVTKYVYDDLGRTVQVIEADGETDERSTLTVYDGVNNKKKLIADLDNSNAESVGDQVTEYFYEDVHVVDLLTKTVYPDSTGASDSVVVDYHLDGRVDTRTDPHGTVLTTVYDSIRRPVSQQVTTVGAGIGSGVRSIVTAYDDMGRREFISSYDNTAGTGTPLDQIQYVYNDLGQLITEYQEHDGAVNTSTSPKVQLTYDLAATSGVLDNGARLASMVYPNGAEVELGYDGHSGLDDLLSRPNKILAVTGPSTTKTLAEYHYTAGGMMVKKLLGDSADDQLVLDFTGDHPDTSSTEEYGGVDRFGRISRMHWSVDDGSTETDAFDIRHGYDRASNKLYAERKIYTNHTQVFGHDDLHRMTSVERGFGPAASGSHSAISDLPGVGSSDLVFNGEKQDWDLDALGNPVGIGTGTNGTFVKNTSFSDANEYESREADALQGTDRLADWFSSSSTAGNWESIGSETASISGGHLNVSTVVADNVGGQVEGAARAVFLWGGEFGPIANETRFKFSTSITTTTRAGVVFGYQDEHNYWISAYKYVPSGQSKREICQVVNGVLTVKASSNITITLGSNTGPHFGSTRELIQEAGLTYSSFANGYPAGRIGVYTDNALVTFDYWQVWPHDKPSDLAGRWDRYSSSDTASGSLLVINSDIRRHYPTLLRGVRHQADKPWRATFMFRRSGASRNRDGLRFLFNVQDHDKYDAIAVFHEAATPSNPLAASLTDGLGTTVSGTATPSNVPLAANQNDDLWVRVEYDDSTNKLTLKSILDNTGEPSDATWSSTGVAFETTNFTMSGGRVGFRGIYGSAYVKEFKLETDNDDNGTFTTEYVEDMGANWSTGYTEVEHEHDASGNLTFDGTFKFTYDAWNRLTKIENAYRDPDAPTVVQTGSTIASYRYDAVNRRIVREQTNAGDLDGEFHDYYTAGWQRIETRDGSGNSLKMNVWGLGYIDELVLTSLNSSDAGNSSFGSDGLGTDSVGDRFFAAHDSLFNVMGLYAVTNGDELSLRERYEYTPYGERQVYVSAGSDDPLAMTPVARGSRDQGIMTAALPINDIGFQGREHDEVSGLVYHRNRMTHAKLGRFMQRDPLGYVDGMHVYASYYAYLGLRDPLGLGCKVWFKCYKHDCSKDPDNATRRICHYTCFEIRRSDTGFGTTGCDEIPSNLIIFEEDTRMTCCECRENYNTSHVYNKKRKRKSRRCSRSACRSQCNKAAKAMRIACLASGRSGKACNKVVDQFLLACESSCNAWCRLP